MEAELDRPIRVVMFSSGPELTHDIKEFIYRLELHPEIELAGIICQAESTTVAAIWKDLWKRRKALAIPLFLMRILTGLLIFLKNPAGERLLNKKLEELSDRFIWVPDIHAQAVLDHVSSLQPDLGLIYGSPILKPALFELPKFGTLGIHHGKLPVYRGNKTTFWAMYNDEQDAWVTIQKVNAGLDTGNIVKEGAVPIGCRTYRAVWNDLLLLGLDLYIDAILEVKNGTAVYQPLMGKKGKLYRNPKSKDFIQFWFRQIKKRLRNALNPSHRSTS